MSTEWIAWLRDLTPGQPAALVGVLATEGSAPRGVGTRMLVTADALLGTIGGGALEHRAIAQARVILAEPPGSWRVQDYPLGPLLGQCCGGRVRLLVEHVDPAALGWLDAAVDGATLVTTLGTGVTRHLDAVIRPFAPPARGERPGAGTIAAERLGQHRRPLYLFGAGHVGQAIVRHAAGLPLELSWFDSRPELASLAGVTVVPPEHMPDCIATARTDTAVLILTHDHALDYALCRAALASPAVFVGLIGSATKYARFVARLRDEGLGERADVSLTCPIGIPGLPGKEPDVIAISALAQLLGLGAA